MNTFHAFCVAAPRSGEGKTTLSLALMRLLARKSMQVQAFKCGPDYIDPTFHSLVTNRLCANLDTWMMGEPEVQRVFSVKSQNADISICEGVMGLFDGKIQKKDSTLKENTIPSIQGSTAHCAQILNIPIILIINAKGMASSIAALVTGFVSHAQKYNIQIVGIIANNVGSPRHSQILSDALSMWNLPPLLGFLPRKDEWRIQERQLGLLPCEESDKNMAWADSIADILEENLNVEQLLNLTQIPRPTMNLPLEVQGKHPACDLPLHTQNTNLTYDVPSHTQNTNPACDLQLQAQNEIKNNVLAIARDEAFCFYYEANIKALEHIGWKIIYFSPLHDKHLPNADALYFGGGYPEVFAKQLSENQNMRKEIYDFSQANGEIFAECGGYMYLTKELLTQNDVKDTKPTTSSNNKDTKQDNSQDANQCNKQDSNKYDNEDHDNEKKFNDTVSYPMCGIINGIAHMGKKMRSLGYREINMHANTIFNAQISQSPCYRGHEFHWSHIELQENYSPLASVDGVAHGVIYKNVRASYLHFYWANKILNQENVINENKSKRSNAKNNNLRENTAKENTLEEKTHDI